MNNIYRLILFLPVFILGCAPNVLEGNKAVRTKINVEGFAEEKVIITGKKLNKKQIILTRINNLNLFKKINSKN